MIRPESLKRHYEVRLNRPARAPRKQYSVTVDSSWSDRISVLRVTTADTLEKRTTL